MKGRNREVRLRGGSREARGVTASHITREDRVLGGWAEGLSQNRLCNSAVPYLPHWVAVADVLVGVTGQVRGSRTT